MERSVTRDAGGASNEPCIRFARRGPQRSDLLDHFVGTAEQRQREREAERLGGLEIDEQLDLRGLLHRQVRRLLALEYPASLDAALTVPVRNAASIAQQATGGGELTQLVDRWQRVAQRQIGELIDLTVVENIGTDHEAGRL